MNFAIAAERQEGKSTIEAIQSGVVYGFAGRNAQQTLGLLLTKQRESQGLAPLGFVATDYAGMAAPGVAPFIWRVICSSGVSLPSSSST